MTPNAVPLSSEALKPCPFCGSAPAVETHAAGDGWTGREKRVVCRDRGCFGPTTSWYADREAMTDAWNRRASPSSPPEIAELVERLRSGHAAAPELEVVWVQNMRAFIATEMFRTFPEWREVFLTEFNAMLAASGEAAFALIALSRQVEELTRERDAAIVEHTFAAQSVASEHAGRVAAEERLAKAVDALRQAETVMSIVEPRSDKAKYLEALTNVRAIVQEIDHGE